MLTTSLQLRMSQDIHNQTWQRVRLEAELKAKEDRLIQRGWIEHRLVLTMKIINHRLQI